MHCSCISLHLALSCFVYFASSSSGPVVSQSGQFGRLPAESLASTSGDPDVRVVNPIVRRSTRGSRDENPDSPRPVLTYDYGPPSSRSARSRASRPPTPPSDRSAPAVHPDDAHHLLDLHRGLWLADEQLRRRLRLLEAQLPRISAHDTTRFRRWQREVDRISADHRAGPVRAYGGRIRRAYNRYPPAARPRLYRAVAALGQRTYEPVQRAPVLALVRELGAGLGLRGAADASPPASPERSASPESRSSENAFAHDLGQTLLGLRGDIEAVGRDFAEVRRIFASAYEEIRRSWRQAGFLQFWD